MRRAGAALARPLERTRKARLTIAQRHFEPYLYLPELTRDAALIAWGGFYFDVSRSSNGRLEIVDDELLVAGRQHVIGQRSESYGEALVEVFDDSGQRVRRESSRERNYVWVRGLEPNRRYRYEVRVDGKPWAAGARWDWLIDESDPARHGLVPSGREYQNVFRTHPALTQSEPLSFVVLGDYGVGIRGATPEAGQQRRVARALEAAVERFSPRLLLTTGDNIYLVGRENPNQGSGSEDDDWFFTFYQPYRYVINRLPVYPSVGNHDAAETEHSDDREQLADNFFLRERFYPDGDGFEGSASVEPGLFYRFRFGRDVEFVCLDTSAALERDERYFFESPSHLQFLKETFEVPRADSPRWTIPFCHHPPYCAGPAHENTDAMLEVLLPLFRRAGVCAVFSGHEHNFQYSQDCGLHFLVSGAGGQLRRDPPRNFERAHTVAWAAEAHLLLAQIEHSELRVRPIADVAGGELRDVELSTRDGASYPTPITVHRDGRR